LLTSAAKIWRRIFKTGKSRFEQESSVSTGVSPNELRETIVASYQSGARRMMLFPTVELEPPGLPEGLPLVTQRICLETCM
jgi:hypothetical protein